MGTNYVTDYIKTTTKLSEEDYNSILDKFNKLNQQYNAKLENSFFHKNDYKYDILNLTDEDLMYFIDKAKSELTNNKKNIDDINLQIEIYEDYLENINTLKKFLDETNNIYSNLLLKSNKIELSDKSIFPQNIYSFEKENFIKLLKNDVDIKIENLKEEFSKNINNVVRFKNLLLKATPEQKKINICIVCSTNKINVCINPCGHTFCKSCTDKMKNICGMCRGNITSKIKLYLEDNDDNDEDNSSKDIEPFIGFNNSFMNYVTDY